MTRITRALRLARQSWDLLLLQPTLLVLPAAGALACGVLLAILVLPVVLGSGPMALLTYDAGLGSYVLLAIAAYALTAVTVFFRVALAHCSACLLDGDETSVHHGIEVAAARLPRILLWSLITTTVGLALRAIAERIPAGGRLLELVGGAAWAAATYFVVPALALDDVGPIGAIRTSARTVRGRWGEAAVGAGGIGVATSLAMIATFVAGGLLAALVNAAGLGFLAAVLLVLVVLAALAVGLVGSALGVVFQTALYLYAGDGDPGDFDEDDLASAFSTRGAAAVGGSAAAA
jgi:hypothetical protein